MGNGVKPAAQPGDVHDSAADATAPVRPGAAQTGESAPALSVDEETAEAADQAIWQRLRAGFQLSQLQHPRINHEIRRLKRSPVALRGLLMRAEPYLHHILNEVEAAGLPTELALLPAVESGFRAHVYSPDGAAGLWQFMPATGRMMGLHQDWWHDKRRSVNASTTAAMRYLTSLNNRFEGDWLHALAAYNAGAGKVGGAIRRAARRNDPTDFWSLDLPGETDRYVPRLLALAAIVARPRAYGVDLPAIVDTPYFTIVNTGGQIDLNVAARLAGIPVETCCGSMPATNAGPPVRTGRTELLLAIDKVEQFSEALAVLPEDQRLRWQRHRIVRGDSLNRIARQYGVTVKAIRQSNNLKERPHQGRKGSADTAVRIGHPGDRKLQPAGPPAPALPGAQRRFAVHHRPPLRGVDPRPETLEPRRPLHTAWRDGSPCSSIRTRSPSATQRRLRRVPISAPRTDPGSRLPASSS